MFIPWDIFFFPPAQNHLQSNPCQSQALYTIDQILHNNSY